ncbi:hypothetical protein EA187_11515 [Lujinxingia sediminis]|uniref:Tetratricopeptide repeat protein n=1 Tax=Lujinxingia sediminis TaxID=2480984 RepID=A0ABY0CTN4_9DELT|nr:hypothetical protein [Lujinxingia sediminis]RVU44167.1 hypothetical protein EA187_11515 [Lujinxingia sediminis]
MSLRSFLILTMMALIPSVTACSSAPPPESESPTSHRPATPPRAEVLALLQEADALWEARHTPESLDRALSAYDDALARHLEEALLDESELYELQRKRARAYAFAARAALAGAAAPSDEAARAANSGAEAARAALNIRDDSSQARYWLAQNLMLGARAEGTAARLERSTELNTLLDALATSPPEALQAEVHLILARRTCEADFGRDRAACANHIDAAEEIAPDHPDVTLARASLLAIAQNDRASFKSHLDELIARDPQTLSPEGRLARLEALALLDAIDRYFAPASP